MSLMEILIGYRYKKALDGVAEIVLQPSTGCLQINKRTINRILTLDKEKQISKIQFHLA